MVALDAVIGVLLGAVPRGWDELVEHDRVGRRLVGDHLNPVSSWWCRWPGRRGMAGTPLRSLIASERQRDLKVSPFVT
jgi:hypothetical protein